LPLQGLVGESRGRKNEITKKEGLNQRSLPSGKPGPDMAGDSVPSKENLDSRAFFFFFLFQFVQREMKIYRCAGKRGQSEP
jgi:hypothetical protein